MSCKATSIAAFPKTIPVEPPRVNIINIERMKRHPDEIEIFNTFPRIVHNQFINLVPVGKEIIMVNPVK